MQIYEQYGSVLELSDTLSKNKSYKVWEAHSPFTTMSVERLKSWAGETYEDSMKYLATGDADKAKKIKAQGEILAEATTGKIPRIEVAVQGCIPCVPNYLRGVPTNMLKIKREHTQKPVIDMYVDCTIYDGIDTDEVAKAGAKIANVITATEMAGVRVNLYAICGVSKKDDQMSMCVRIKDANSPLNLLNVAYAICNRAFCRCTFLKWMEIKSKKYIKLYGSPMSINRIKQTFGLDGVCLSMIDIVNADSSIEEITKQVNEYLANQR